MAIRLSMSHPEDHKKKRRVFARVYGFSSCLLPSAIACVTTHNFVFLNLALSRPVLYSWSLYLLSISNLRYAPLLVLTRSRVPYDSWGLRRGHPHPHHEAIWNGCCRIAASPKSGEFRLSNRRYGPRSRPLGVLQFTRPWGRCSLISCAKTQYLRSMSD